MLEHNMTAAGFADIHSEGGCNAFQAGDASVLRIAPHRQALCMTVRT
jgi:hypothetical protein